MKMDNIKEQFARLYMELDLTDDQAAMIKKLQRDVDAALRKHAVSGRSEQLPQKSEHCVSISPEPCKHKGVCEICS